MRKRIIIGISIVALVALAIVGLGWARTAYAQAQTPPSPGYGYGMMGGQYGGFGMMGNWDNGPMHEYMVSALADALNLTPEEIQTRIDNGETPWQIAQAQGLSEEQIQQVMLDAHDKSLDKTVEAGILTQEQADWMDQHMESMWSGDFSGFGGCHGPVNGTGSTDSGTRYGPMMRGSRAPSL
jgi:hypothetical protein